MLVRAPSIDELDKLSALRLVQRARLIEKFFVQSDRLIRDFEPPVSRIVLGHERIRSLFRGTRSNRRTP
jgi:hypothetical protein